GTARGRFAGYALHVRHKRRRQTVSPEMITRFESTPEHLIVESRRTPDARAVVLVSAGVAFFVLILTTQVLGLGRTDSGEFSGQHLTTIAALMMAAGLGFPLLAAPWLFFRCERIVVRGRGVTHERLVGSIRTSRANYELFKMRGLRELCMGDSDQCAAGLWFWYGRSAAVLGDTLKREELARLRDELLAYDARAREALGMDARLGLADVAAWDSAEVRRAMFEEQWANRRHVVFPRRDPDDW
ncbi:MAG: hypothetical protein U1E29_06780, partial [Coriobacteriia bacterium]|nr:hypothetical protein [Coriobacteriia bacterium]